MNSYKPGQAVRCLASVTELGAPTNVSPLTLTIHSPGGTQYTPSIVNDSTGNYHADFAIPIGETPGTWIQRWQTTNATPALNALVEALFIVQPLAF
ncbi:MAG: hypothetical protein WBX26_10620 [Candidatus Cybelea sp.]